jgi:uncharacterized protein (DUF58 family)
VYVTGRLPLLVAAGAVPVMLLSIAGVDAWLAAAGWLALCTAAALMDASAAPSAKTLAVERHVPRKALLGERVTTRLTLRNPGPRRLAGALRDAWQPTAGAPTGRATFAVAPAGVTEIEVPLRPRRRGELSSEFVVIRSAGPLGLAGRQRRIDVRGAIRVLPAFTSRRHLPSRVALLRRLDGSASVQLRGQGTEFDSLREYVRGDDVRSIDWRATARSTDTMIRTWRPERDRQVVILVDTGRTAAARVGDGVRLDAAMEATLLLAALAREAGDHVHVVLFDRIVRARVSRVEGAALLPALVDAMADVDAQLIDTDWDAAFAQVAALTTRPSLVAVITAQDAVESARGFLGSLPALTARTRVLVASVGDDPVRIAERPDAADVYREAAAARAQAESERVADAIRRAGADTVTGDPDRLPPALADRYLALKAAGRL